MIHSNTVAKPPLDAYDVAGTGKRQSAQHQVPIEELLPAAFIARHTRLASLSTFLTPSGLAALTQSDLTARATRDWDYYVQSVSDSHDWNSMLRAARGEWILRRLGLAIDA
jgi:hypothetical protein